MPGARSPAPRGPATDFVALLRRLAGTVIGGGAAASARESARFSLDLGVVYRRSGDNVRRGVMALEPYRQAILGGRSRFPRGAIARPISRESRALG